MKPDLILLRFYYIIKRERNLKNQRYRRYDKDMKIEWKDLMGQDYEKSKF